MKCGGKHRRAKSQRLNMGGGNVENRSSREAEDNIDVSLLYPEERNDMDGSGQAPGLRRPLKEVERGNKAFDS